MYFWVYLTLVEQLILLVGVIFILGYCYFYNKAFHKLQFILIQFCLIVCSFLILNIFDFLFVKLFILLLCFLVLLFWQAVIWVLNWNFRLELQVLFLFNVVSMLLLVSSLDLMLVYLVLESQSLILYTLVVLFKSNQVSFFVEGSLKYFITGGIASFGVLIGCVLLYIFTGSSNLNVLTFLLLKSSNLFSVLYFSVCLIFFTILFKLALVPLHYWSIDVARANPFFLVLFLLTGRKIPIFSLVGLISKFLYFNGLYVNWVFVSFLITSLVLGLWGSFNQLNLGRLFAFNSSANMSLVLSGFLLNSCLLSLNSWNYLYVYTFLVLFVLGIFSVLLKSSDSSKGVGVVLSNFSLLDLKSLDFFVRVSLRLGFFILGFIGVPRLSGFFIKYFLINNLISLGLSFFGGFLLIFNILGVFVYLRLLKQFYYAL